MPQEFVTDPELIAEFERLEREAAEGPKFVKNPELLQQFEELEQTQIQYPFIPPEAGVRITEDAEGRQTFSNPVFTTTDPALISGFINYYAGGPQRSELVSRRMAGAEPVIPYYQGQPRAQRERALEQAREFRETAIPPELTAQLRPPETPEEAQLYETFDPVTASVGKAIASAPFSGERVPQFLGITQPEQIDILEEIKPGIALAASVGPELASLYFAGPKLFQFAVKEGDSLARATLKFGGYGAALGLVEGAFSTAFAPAEGWFDYEVLGQELSYGGLGGATLGIVPGAHRLGRAIGNIFTGNNVGRVQRAFNVDREGAEILMEVFRRADVDEIAEQLKRYGADGASLANASPAVQTLVAHAVYSGSESALETLRATQSRVPAAWNRFNNNLDNSFGEQIRDEARSITILKMDEREFSQPYINDAYVRAYQKRPQWNTREGRELMEVFRNINPSVIRAANRNIREKVVEVERDSLGRLKPSRINPNVDRTIQFRVNENTNRIEFDAPLTTEQVDEIQRALGGLADRTATRNAAGQIVEQTDTGRRFGEQQERINALFRRISPDIDEAMTRARQSFKTQQNYDIGYQVFDDSVPVADFNRMVQSVRRIKNVDVREKEIAELRRGARLAIDQKLERVNYFANDDLVTDEQFVKIIEEFRNPQNRARMRTIIGAEETEELFRNADELIDLAILEKMAAGARTRGGISAGIEAAQGRQRGALDRFSGFYSSALARFGLDFLTNQDPRFDGIRRETWDQIARGISNLRGPNGARAARIAQDIAMGRDIVKKENDWFFSYIVTPGFIAASRKEIAPYADVFERMSREQQPAAQDQEQNR